MKISVVLIFFVCAVRASDKVQVTPFLIGDTFSIECLNHTTGNYGSFITCKETSQPMEFKYGVDEFAYCGWTLDETAYKFAREVMAQKTNWACRAPMSKDKAFYMPVNIPLWGVVEDGHIHLNYHMNFVFHGNLKGQIIAATVYPVRDRFQFGKVGSTVNVHGPVRWFEKDSYKKLSESSGSGIVQGIRGHSTGSLVLSTCLSCLCTTLTLTIFYLYHLRPNLVKRLVKAE